MKILGIWDGHDSGAAIIENDKILFAVNEERLTRRKLEVTFPVRSIRMCLSATEISPEKINHIAVSTSDFSKTLTRVFPALKEEYYLIRRRKKGPDLVSAIKKSVKYKLTEYGPSVFSRWVSDHTVRRNLGHLRFRKYELHLVDHHHAHAAAAAFCSGLTSGLVATLDGVGDGLCGTFYKLNEGKLSRVRGLSARHSLGIFFEHVTTLMNMRELEDEGKVMALANYAYPVDDNKNPMLDMVSIVGLQIQCHYSSMRMFRELQKIHWRYPSEQFAYMAQRTLELKALELVQNALKFTGEKNLCLAGGVFSNVKLNRVLRLLPEVHNCFVFPHMGDGGLAMGAALAVSTVRSGPNHVALENCLLGPAYHEQQIEEVLKKSGLSYTRHPDIAQRSARLIADGEIVLWFQGRMEYGPRALGGRSIVARPDSEAIKDTLNMRLKKRVWYQPFCPSMLEDDAREIFEDYDNNTSPFMTMAYKVKKDKLHTVRGVINVDGSCRPQIISDKKSPFWHLLAEIKKLTGRGIILNTSFNLHGEPLVCSPNDAVNTMIQIGNSHMAIGNFMVVR